MKITLLLILILHMNIMGSCQITDMFFNSKGVSGFTIGDNIKKDSTIKPLSKHPDLNAILEPPISGYSFFYKDIVIDPVIKNVKVLNEIFIAVDSSFNIQSITIFLIDSTGNFHVFLDKIFGRKSIKANSFMQNVATSEKIIWNSDVGIEVFLIRKEVNSNLSFDQIQIYSTMSGISSNESSISYPKIFMKYLENLK